MYVTVTKKIIIKLPVYYKKKVIITVMALQVMK